ncbi:Secondary metabolism regulator LAE1 [Colletotrichum siamense]|uniref:Secondary metabolism regulator LAE1 n=1 Tax=Colletotrichum siamense TaxID=690259 RepID=A0A9P5K0S5_COLSI|nr:Secondary metabolism regulator LAE1 [Colletotrichum siamense]KAF4853726.1 Secondary metabolism regulator LAE1 [Colletotrichum siamense]
MAVAETRAIDHEVAIAADDVTDDSASESGSFALSSKSVTSSLLQYRVENGRTYHFYKEGKYVMPNDDRESDRLDAQHRIMVITLGGWLGLAPPCDPKAKVGRVLDVGTGTGIWAADFGAVHPEADVLGMDLSAPQIEIAPDNVRFEIDDLEEEWIYSRPFDYIHHRLLNSCINDWDVYLTKIYENLVPGGYVELQEGEIRLMSDDDTLPADSDLAKYIDLLQEAAEKNGRRWMDMRAVKAKMLDIGFVDVELYYYKWPINDWPKHQYYKDLGTLNYENTFDALEAMCVALFTRVLKWKRHEVNVFLINVRKDLKNRAYHAYFPIPIIVGRKPGAKKAPAKTDA